MSETAMRGFTRAFCEALASRDPAKVETFLADDVEWTVFGPADLFPFVGRRYGKVAALAALRDIASRFEMRDCARETMLVADDSAAALVRFTVRHVATGRTLCFRLAHFMRLRDGRLAGLEILLDSLDAAEQVLGRQIDLTAA